MDGMKSQDLVVLLKLVSLQEEESEPTPGQPQPRFQGDDPYSVRNLEALLGISKTEINASIKRSLSSGLAIKDRNTGRANPNRRNLNNFIIHGMKFVFPAKPGGHDARHTDGLCSTYASKPLGQRRRIHLRVAFRGRTEHQAIGYAAV
ncbi:biotin operon repressor [Bradyrhizobium elkanii]|nr:biotin operon repressor [Bradyrhizobium elkanii]MCS4066877.1 biotin operon repressor [Bradyrhizobium elkanii]MCS4082412.1 biotin operon repressor [Bradyrhizobium elkanii]MCW2128010.1 biotin operon repressor [Bradyrhizobium elkanii]MCW2174751.1 biotin operon repressor [Bradyrhizobium elkanii]